MQQYTVIQLYSTNDNLITLKEKSNIYYLSFYKERPILELLLKKRNSKSCKQICTDYIFTADEEKSCRYSFHINNTDTIFNSEKEIPAINVSNYDLWLLNQWKPFPYFELKTLKIEDIILCYHQSAFNITPQHLNSIDRFIDYKNSEYHFFTDIHLIIPICYDSNIKTNYNIQNKTIDEYIAELNRSNEIDYYNTYYDKLSRCYLGNYFIKSEDDYQSCFVVQSLNETVKLGIIDIIIPNSFINCNKILQNFRHGNTIIMVDEKDYNIFDWIKTLNFQPVGEHRGIVFSSASMDTESIVNILASEHNPMAHIIGESFKDMVVNNIAQYNTAKVYASEVSFLEITNSFIYDTALRLKYQALDIFLIELLSIQDAAISRITNKLYSLQKEQENFNTNKSFKDFSNLISQMNQVSMLFDSRNIKFPTVRISTEKLAEQFGLNKLKILNDSNKDILEKLINIHKIEQEKKSNSILNIILLCLTFIQIVPIILQIKDNISRGNPVNSLSLSVYFCIVLFMILIIVFLFRQKRK